MVDTVTFSKILFIILVLINILFIIIILMFTTDESHQYYLFTSLTFINLIFLIIFLTLYKDLYNSIYESEYPRSIYDKNK